MNMQVNSLCEMVKEVKTTGFSFCAKRAVVWPAARGHVPMLSIISRVQQARCKCCRRKLVNTQIFALNFSIWTHGFWKLVP